MRLVFTTRIQLRNPIPKARFNFIAKWIRMAARIMFAPLPKVHGKFIPAMDNGKRVAGQFNLAIDFAMVNNPDEQAFGSHLKQREE